MGKGVPVPATMTEQTNTFCPANKAHGRLTGVSHVFHQWYNYVGSINKDDNSKLLCLSVLLSLTRLCLYHTTSISI